MLTGIDILPQYKCTYKNLLAIMHLHFDVSVTVFIITENMQQGSLGHYAFTS